MYLRTHPPQFAWRYWPHAGRTSACGLGALSLLPPVDLSSVGGFISSLFGSRTAPLPGASTMHQGIDYAVPSGTPVSAAMNGTVVFAGQQTGYGNTIVVDDGSGVQTLYGHLSSIGVQVGEPVNAGDQIALSGATGLVTGPHLHFGVSVNGQWVDPSSYLNAAPVPTPTVTATAYTDASGNPLPVVASADAAPDVVDTSGSIDPALLAGGLLVGALVIYGLAA